MMAKAMGRETGKDRMSKRVGITSMGRFKKDSLAFGAVMTGT